MKRLFSIGLLLIFVSAYMKPYIPYLDYMLNQNFIAENLCENKDKPELKCHGQCHLKKELKKIAEENKQEPAAPPKNGEKKNELQLNMHTPNKEHFSFFSEKNVHFYFYEEMNSQFILNLIIPPPEFGHSHLLGT